MVIKPDALYNALVLDLLLNGMEPGLVGNRLAHLHDDTRQAAMGYQANSFLKRSYAGESPQAEKRAIAEFERCNAICAGPSIDASDFVVPDVLDVVFGEAKELIHGILDAAMDSVRKDGILGLWRCGPGVNLDVGAGNTSLYEKMSSRLSYPSDDALLLAGAAWAETVHTWNAEGIPNGEPLVQGHVNLITVRKNAEVRRTITTHTNGGTAGQLSIAAHLRYGLNARTGIDIKTQADRHRRMIRARWSKFATVDLKSASNLISVKHVRFFFGHHPLHRWIMAFREGSYRYRGKEFNLYMYAGMGNGITFPLQTILFLSLAYGVYRLLGLEVQWPSGVDDGNIGVFGDDIVIVPEAYDLLLRVLRALRMEPNGDKSFRDGPFRESCGVDTHKGRNIRPVFLLSTDRTHDLNDLYNRLMEWSVRCDVTLFNTLGLIVRKLRQIRQLFLVPLHAASTAGLRVPEGIALKHSAVQYEVDDGDPNSPHYGGCFYHYLEVKAKLKVVAADFREVVVDEVVEKQPVFTKPGLALQSMLYGEQDPDARVGVRVGPDESVKTYRAVQHTSRWNDNRIDNPSVAFVVKCPGIKALVMLKQWSGPDDVSLNRWVERAPSAQDVWVKSPTELTTQWHQRHAVR